MKQYAVVLLVFVLCMSVGTAWALFESKKELVNGARISMADAVEAAVKVVPGKAVESEIDSEHDRTVFEVEIITNNGETKEVYIDAQTGDARKIEHE